MTTDFSDVLAANAEYARTFPHAGLEPKAANGLAIVTCMDSRIEPLTMLGLKPGDAKILRNAGARVTDEVLRTLVVAVHMLGVTRVLVVPHTRCRMTSPGPQDVHDAIRERSGLDTRSLDLRPVPDVRATLRDDLQRIRSWPYLPDSLGVLGAVYDGDTGRLEPLDS